MPRGRAMIHNPATVGHLDMVRDTNTVMAELFYAMTLLDHDPAKGALQAMAWEQINPNLFWL